MILHFLSICDMFTFCDTFVNPTTYLHGLRLISGLYWIFIFQSSLGFDECGNPLLLWIVQIESACTSSFMILTLVIHFWFHYICNDVGSVCYLILLDLIKLFFERCLILDHKCTTEVTAFYVPLRPIRSVDVKLYVLKTTKTTKINVQPQAVYILWHGKNTRRAELLLYLFWLWRQAKRFRTYIFRIESWISII
jgi:hypothetical protein